MVKRVLLLSLLLAVGAVGAVWWWAHPREDVAMPPDHATPEQVVRAYVAALNARDFETSNALAPGEGYGRFSRTHRIDDLEIVSTRDGHTPPGSGTTTKDEYDDAVDVMTEGVWSGTDISMEDGLQPWSFGVARNAGEPWRIVDQGMG